jgi:hypothetical protein
MCLSVSRLFWVSSLAYPNLLGIKGYVVVVGDASATVMWLQCSVGKCNIPGKKFVYGHILSSSATAMPNLNLGLVQLQFFLQNNPVARFVVI